MRKLLSAGLILISILQFSCTSFFLYRDAEQAYNRKDYYHSAQTLILLLHHEPANQKAIRLLEDVFPAAVSRLLENIANVHKEKSDFRWDSIVEDYRKLHALNKAVQEIAPLYLKKERRNIVLEITYYYTELEEAGEMAAAAHYNAGIALMEMDDRASKKEANMHFKKALDYVPGYRDAEKLALSSAEAATRQIFILPTIGTDQYGSFKIPPVVYNALLSEITRGVSSRPFIRIIDRENLDLILEQQRLNLMDISDNASAVKIGKLLGANLILTSEISYSNYFPPETTSREEKLEKEVREKVESAEDPDVKVDKITEYMGKIIYYTKTTYVLITGSYKLIDIETAELLDSDIIQLKEEDKAHWATFKGDPEVLENQHKILLKNDHGVKSFDELISNAAIKFGKRIAAGVLTKLD